jgi:SAM-dependent methyltransferase
MTAQQTTEQPSLSDQVSRLYEIIGGYHATNLLKIAHELGVWAAITSKPGVTSQQLAGQLGTNAFYTDVLCRTAFAFGLLDRLGDGWQMGPHFDQILGNPDSTFYLASAASVHMKVGEDYENYVQHFRAGTHTSYQAHDAAFMEEVGNATVALPRIFLDFVLPGLPALEARLQASAHVLDLGCGAGWAVVQIAERFPQARCVGLDIEPNSVDLAQSLIREKGLGDRCEARVGSAELADSGDYDVITSFLVVHEIHPSLKKAAFADVARALKPGGFFLIFDEAYPETDQDLRTMPARFAALAQWYEVTYGNRVNTRSELIELCNGAGLEVESEKAFSRFHIILARKP